MVAHTCNPSTQWLRQDDHEFHKDTKVLVCLHKELLLSTKKEGTIGTQKLKIMPKLDKSTYNVWLCLNKIQEIQTTVNGRKHTSSCLEQGGSENGGRKLLVVLMVFQVTSVQLQYYNSITIYCKSIKPAESLGEEKLTNHIVQV